MAPPVPQIRLPAFTITTSFPESNNIHKKKKEKNYFVRYSNCFPWTSLIISWYLLPETNPWENKWAPWAHRELTVATAPGPNDHGSVTARRGHSSVTARSQISHGEVTAQSRHLQYDHSSIMAQVTAGCDHFGHHELTVSSQWAHGEQSRWPIFFSWAFHKQFIGLKLKCCKNCFCCYDSNDPIIT